MVLTVWSFFIIIVELGFFFKRHFELFEICLWAICNRIGLLMKTIFCCSAWWMTTFHFYDFWVLIINGSSKLMLEGSLTNSGGLVTFNLAFLWRVKFCVFWCLGFWVWTCNFIVDLGCQPYPWTFSFFLFWPHLNWAIFLFTFWAFQSFPFLYFFPSIFFNSLSSQFAFLPYVVHTCKLKTFISNAIKLFLGFSH